MAGSTSSMVQDEQEIRQLKDVFARGFLTKDAKLRASIWTEDGTVVPPQGGFFRGREAMAEHFKTEEASLTASSRMTFSDFRFRFINRDAAFVDAEITLNDVLGPDAQVHPVVPITVVFSAVRRNGNWFVQDERAFFKMP